MRKSDAKIAMAALLITSSVALAMYLGVVDHDIRAGVRWYIAQAFLTAGSLFGIDYYARKLFAHDNH